MSRTAKKSTTALFALVILAAAAMLLLAGTSEAKDLVFQPPTAPNQVGIGAGTVTCVLPAPLNPGPDFVPASAFGPNSNQTLATFIECKRFCLDESCNLVGTPRRWACELLVGVTACGYRGPGSCLKGHTTTIICEATN